MSVITAVDDYLEQAKTDIDSAISHLDKVLDKNTWGHDDLREEYTNMIFKLSTKLRKISRKLK